ncbi:MAG: hypothetical protein A2161_20935 [Candidatus Schekmanbacteria bacterium RBG_13_48_7]|uniref:Uncharacterized protein n=1 Tax=Candidatus Schekmanbacteria bacterium RBG_13_48_7 TaxID=1817878 RepID=A0A1F7S0A4_9BACT|nr:MAG: hypothetical protein A2161_20935 [Candidatus Schekmanbacteria bacterium RBG_13_48_7]
MCSCYKNNLIRIKHFSNILLFGLLFLPNCYSHSSRYIKEGCIVESQKSSSSLPSEVAPRIIKHIIRFWDSERKLNRLEEQRTAVAISEGLMKNGYAKWLFSTRWIEVYISKDDPDKLISKILGTDLEPQEQIKINLIEYR